MAERPDANADAIPDREIVTSRVLDAQRELVSRFSAYP